MENTIETKILRMGGKLKRCAFAMLTAAMSSVLSAQAFVPQDQYDSPPQDILVDAIGLESSSYYVIAFESETYGLVNGIGPEISVTVKNNRTSSAGVGIRFWNRVNDPSMQELGSIAAAVSVESVPTTWGLMLDTVGFAENAVISSNVFASSETQSSYGIEIATDASRVKANNYVYAGKLESYTYNPAEGYNIAFGINVRDVKMASFEVRDAEIFASAVGSPAYALQFGDIVEDLKLTANSKLIAKSEKNAAYALIAPGKLNLSGDLSGTQVLKGHIYAMASNKTRLDGITIGSGNYEIDSFGAYLYIYSPTILITREAQMKFLKPVFFLGNTTRRAQTEIHGALSLYAESVEDYALMIGEDADIVIADDASLTLILQDGFAAEPGDQMELLAVSIDDEDGTEMATVSGSFSDKFSIKHADGTPYEGKYSFDGMILTFLDEGGCKITGVSVLGSDVTLTAESDKAGYFAVYGASELLAEEGEWVYEGARGEINGDGVITATFPRNGGMRFYRVIVSAVAFDENGDASSFEYSVNVGGYYTVSLPARIKQYVANQFDQNDRSIAAVFSELPRGAMVGYIGEGGSSKTATKRPNGTWTEEIDIPRGMELQITVASDTDFIFSGTLDGTTVNKSAFARINTLSCSALPIPGDPVADMGVPQMRGLMLGRIDGTGKYGNLTIRPNGTWETAPDVRVGEAFMLTYTSGTEWSQTLVIPEDSFRLTVDFN